MLRLTPQHDNNDANRWRARLRPSQLLPPNGSPIGMEGGVNLYAYVGNGVVMGVDPSGLKVRFCARPTVFPNLNGGDLDTAHWFLWSDLCSQTRFA